MEDQKNPIALKKKRNNSLPSKGWIFPLVVAFFFFLFFYLIKSVLLPFVLGILIAYFLNPVADRLNKLGFSRTIATASISLLFFSLIILVSITIIPMLVSQLVDLLSVLPSYALTMEQQYEKKFVGLLGSIPKSYANNLQDLLSNFSGLAVKFAGGMAGGIFASGMAIINFFSLFLITPVVSFYMLRDWDKITGRFHALLPRKYEKTIREQLSLIDQTLAGFIRGQMNVCLVLAIFYSVGLSLVGLKFAVLIGIATGILVIIPYLGQGFGMLVGLVAAYFQFDDISQIFPVLIVFIVGQVLEGSVITPKLVGEKVGLHPVWIIFGLLAGAALFGFVGVLIAVPVSAVIGVLIRFALSSYLASGYYKQ